MWKDGQTILQKRTCTRTDSQARNIHPCACKQAYTYVVSDDYMLRGLKQHCSEWDGWGGANGSERSQSMYRFFWRSVWLFPRPDEAFAAIFCLYIQKPLMIQCSYTQGWNVWKFEIEAMSRASTDTT